MEFKTSGPLTLEQLLEGLRIEKEYQEWACSKEGICAKYKAWNSSFYMHRRAQYLHAGFPLPEACEKAAQDVEAYGWRY